MARAELAVAALILGAAGCMPRTAPLPDPTLDQTWVYSCPGDYRFSARVLTGLVAIRLPETARAVTLQSPTAGEVSRTVALPRVRAALGTRYAANGVELSSRGATATLKLGPETHADCSGQRVDSPWEEARLLGADFRGAGRDPAWSFEIHMGRYMRFLMEGSSEVFVAVPEPERTPGAARYRVATAGHEIDAIVEEKPCADPRIGDGLTHTVTVTVDGFTHFGCGRMLGSAPPSP